MYDHLNREERIIEINRLKDGILKLMKKKEYNQKHKKNVGYDYDCNYDDNIKNTSPKKNMNPKKSVTLSETEKMWKSLQNALVEKSSTPVSGYPMKLEQLRQIVTYILRGKIHSFYDKLTVIFNEDYIVFKEDGFGWLRNSKLILPLYEGTEDVVFLDVLKSNAKAKEYNINWKDEARLPIAAGLQSLYTKKGISYTNQNNCKVFSIDAITEYYNKYNIALSNHNRKLTQLEMIGVNYKDGWERFSWEPEGYYRVFPRKGNVYRSDKGFATVISKGVNISRADKVLAYALENFKVIAHPLMNEWDIKIYDALKKLYNEGTLTKDELKSMVLASKEFEKAQLGESVVSTDELEVSFSKEDFEDENLAQSLNEFINTSKNIRKNWNVSISQMYDSVWDMSRSINVMQLKNEFFDEIEQINSYEDAINYLGNDWEIKEVFYNKCVQSLLEVETTRANIQPYELDVLRDLNKGHWDVYEMLQRTMEADDVLIPVPKDQTLVARDPLADVNTKATCAIDFGTKSTVVVYHDGKSSLLRIGASDQWAEPRMEDYENPTALHIIDYKQFMEDYNSKAGRPPTRWEDMTVSHHAAEKIYQKDISTDVYYSVFNELKQWANAVGRRQLLQDSTGRKIELKPYTTLKDGDFDPIEIYAYYLGLYINNMQRGICMKYYLSFPVNYSLDVRNRILESFERGIRKSLPERVLNHENTMKRFKVKAGASEPAAYALSALKAYGVEPADNEQEKAHTYGVFDFGGGTTDFDFGIEYIPDNNDYFYEIKQFNNGGDPLLGGENIINILAYEVFKANQQVMRDNKITIVIPNDKCKRFDGSQMLVKDPNEGDQVSYLNLKLLASRMRSIWEEKGDFKDEFSTGDISIDLYSTNEEKIPVRIKVNVPMLQGVITEHIKDGIDNFMGTFKRAYTANESEWTWPLHILLAGNSCKARLLQEQLVIRLMDELEAMSKRLHKDVSDIFRLYPPLGSSFNVEALVKSITASGTKFTAEQKNILDTMLYTETNA